MGNEVTTEEKLCITVEEAGRMLGISRNTAYQCAQDGSIPTIRLARRLVVPRVALMRMLESAAPKPRDDKAA